MSTWQLKGTIPGSGGGTINVHPNQDVGVSQRTVADLGRVPASAGVSVSQAPSNLKVQQIPGVALTQLISGTPSVVILSPGVSVSSKASGGATPPQSVGAELVQVKYDLVQTTFAVGEGSSGRWTAGLNATGPNNGTVATCNNTAIAAASGSIELIYAAQLNKTELIISKVELHRYWQNVAGLVGPCTWTAEYSLNNGSSWTILESGTASFNQMSTPDIDDITTAVAGDWNKLSQLKVRFTYTGAASATPSTLTVDAVKLYVTASKTDIL